MKADRNLGVPCSVGDCLDQARSGGLCWAHSKRRSRGEPASGEIARRPTTKWERLQEASIAYNEAESDEDYQRAWDNFRKAVVACRPTVEIELARAGLAAAKARGVKLGAPRKVEPAYAVQVVETAGSASKAAVILRVSVSTVFRALRAVRGPRKEP